MTLNFTQHDALKCLYKEASNETEEKINIARKEYPSFNNEVLKLQSLVCSLDLFLIKAPVNTVDRILQYSKNKQVKSA